MGSDFRNPLILRGKKVITYANNGTGMVITASSLFR